MGGLPYKQVFDIPCPEKFNTSRIHDIRHTLGRRLRAAEVPALDIAALLGRSGSGGVTEHYADAEILHLIRQAEKVAKPPVTSGSTTLRLVQQSYLERDDIERITEGFAGMDMPCKSTRYGAGRLF